ncbi:hypothetical protein [Brachybacterium hainanense]|uniref:Uncharacterized protein n=1 Tax=Brachybacterium hainanense TaxID=1541174 RepID=A0ABV6RI33_9MICO
MTLPLQEAARAAVRGGTPPRDWNPVYRALAAGVVAGAEAAGTAGPADGGTPEGPETDERTDVLQRQLSARALLVVTATQEDGSTRRLRIGLAPDGATFESSRDGEDSRWWSAPLPAAGEEILALLAEAGVHGPAALTLDDAAPALRPSPAQLERVREELARGAGPEEAFAALEDLDPRLRDALAARGTRLALSLTLHDPQEGPGDAAAASFSRLWVRGALGLYRSDADGPPGQVRPVGDGDVLGTALPLLEQGLAFAASRTTRGGAR